MSANHLTKDGEFRYILQWFNEWSELQRDDFVPVFVDYLLKDNTENGDGVAYMNGVVNALASSGLQDKPMSLFQCRIKLFREWCPKWPADLRHKLKEKINEIDAKVGEKILNELQHNGTHSNINGTIERSEGDNLETERETNAVAAPNESSSAIDTDDNRLAAVLRQETPVDDDNNDDDKGDDNDVQQSQNECVTADAVVENANSDYSVTPSSTTASTTDDVESTITGHALPVVAQPVDQVENNVTSVIASVAANNAAEVPPVA